MTLPLDIHRCRGIGTDRGTPDPDCLDCERRTQGIDDYTKGRRDVWWMAPPTVQPCPDRWEKRK